MPKDKIKSAIDKAFGSGTDAAVYENVVYEGYGPCRCRRVRATALTDNRNRTAADVRSAFSHARRQPGHLRLRGVPVRAQGPDHHRQGDPETENDKKETR